MTVNSIHGSVAKVALPFFLFSSFTFFSFSFLFSSYFFSTSSLSSSTLIMNVNPNSNKHSHDFSQAMLYRLM